MERIPERIDSTFRYVLVAAARAEQLMRKAAPKIEAAGKPARVAMEEISRDVVAWDYGPAPVPVDESPEEGELDGAAEDETED